MALSRICVYNCFLKDSILTDMKVTQLQFRIFFREYSNRPKVSVEIDTNVLDSLERGDIKPKCHAGVIKNINSTLPNILIKNIHSAIGGDQSLKALVADGIKLSQYLHSRHPPPEEKEIESKIEEATLLVGKKYNKSVTNITDEEKEAFQKKYENKIKKCFNRRIYLWKAVDYNEYRSKVYLIGRSSADYAVIYRVFKEMSIHLPDFKPKTLFDFGSGVGTVTWAAKSFWDDSLQEYFCVDSSGFMNDLALSVLKGKEAVDDPPKGYFYRQFLPMSSTLQYDLVVSAFTLFELPSLKSRLETILTLWKKTQNYLVVIEQGTNAGFQIINEIRDFILEFSNNASSSEHAAHVFAPCPHDMQCPRFNEDLTPCNFEVSYTNPFHPSTNTISRERFSYVILKKGCRPKENPQWPRIVRKVLPRHKHVVCRMCTSAGKLQEIVFTASKHGKATYKCARVSHWGDLLPVTLKPCEEVCSEDAGESVNE